MTKGTIGVFGASGFVGSTLCERLYFDVLTVMKQVGIARDPTTLMGRLNVAFSHPWTMLTAGLRLLTG